MKNLSIKFAALSLILTQAACVSMSSLQTAETLAKGRKQTTVGGGYFSSEETSLGKTLDAKAPYLEVSYREGLGDNFDAGVKLTIIGSMAADAKYRLMDGETFDLSVGAGLGYMNLTTGSGTDEIKNTIIDIMIPLYASYRFDENWAVYGTPRYVLRTNSRSGADSASSNQSLVGGAGGVKIGKDWGAYLEAAYQKDTGSDFSFMQYNVSFFWEDVGGIVSSMF